MRKVRHKNVVQFIGACTRRPNLCIVFEFMAGGSIYDYMRKVSIAHVSNVQIHRGCYSTSKVCLRCLRCCGFCREWLPVSFVTVCATPSVPCCLTHGRIPACQVSDSRWSLHLCAAEQTMEPA